MVWSSENFVKSQHSNQKTTQELNRDDHKEEPLQCDQKVFQEPLHMQGNPKAKRIPDR